MILSELKRANFFYFKNWRSKLLQTTSISLSKLTVKFHYYIIYDYFKQFMTFSQYGVLHPILKLARKKKNQKNILSQKTKENKKPSALFSKLYSSTILMKPTNNIN